MTYAPIKPDHTALTIDPGSSAMGLEHDASRRPPKVKSGDRFLPSVACGSQ